jgi:DNA uptake protein ComE-like DNA-binding protein
MTARASSSSSFPSSFRSRRGSVLIIVMWTCLGLVALTLYFANSMSSELRAADNRVTEIEARQAVAGGIRYAGYILANFATNGAVPNVADYKSEALPVGEAQFWMIGRDNSQTPTSEPVFGLIDEASKLNLNTATRAMLTELPTMTPELVEAIISWRRATNAQAAGSDTGDTGGGSESVYARLDPPRLNKGGAFESVDELRLVDGATLDLLLGEDTNRNGALDAHEDDGELSAPRDNQDGQMLLGIFEYVTVYSRQPNTRADGTRRVNVTNGNGQNRQQLIQLLLAKNIEQQRVATIVNSAFGAATPPGGPGGGFPGGQPPRPDLTSVAEFMVASQMTAEEFVLIHADITTATGATQPGLINVNTASEAVLACIPGIGLANASTLAAYRVTHPDVLTSFAWLTQVLPPAAIRQAGRYITDQSYQFTADIAAVGRFGRGYCREKVIFDTRTGTPRIIYHQDLSAYGWALGSQVRQTLKGTNNPS